MQPIKIDLIKTHLKEGFEQNILRFEFKKSYHILEVPARSFFKF